MKTLTKCQCHPRYRDEKILQLVEEIQRFACQNAGSATDLLTEYPQCEDILILQSYLLTETRRIMAAAQDRRLHKNEQIIQQARQYMQEHIDNQLSLESVAEHIGLTPKYFSRIFKDCTGSNFQDELIRLRLEKGLALLLETDLSMEAIALEIGYSSSSYFARQFKAVYSITPAAYRSTHTNKGK